MKLDKKLSLKELILLGILIILAAYYFIVQGPIKRQTEQLEQEKVQLTSEISQKQSLLATKNNMIKELDDIFASYAPDEPPMIPEYNNINNIIFEFHAIFDSTDNYNISFSNENTVGDIVRRDITISYTTYNYDDAISKLESIEKSRNRYMLRTVDLNKSEFGIKNEVLAVFYHHADGYQYNTTINITSYEYIRPDTAAAAK